MKFAAAILLILSVCAHAQSSFGRRAPGFSLPDQTLKQHDLQDYRGKVVLLDFMRTDCPHCQTLTQTLEQVKAKFGDKVQVLSILPANGMDNQQTVAKYMATYKANNPFLFDCGQMSASYLNITPKNPQIHLPQLIIVDKTGMIRRDMSEMTKGGLTVAEISATVEPLVK
jgi:peroxiredoxin